MSAWLELSNELKRRYNSGYLTVTQQSAYTALLEHLRGPNWVNLLGPHGSGKTLLSWLVARAAGLTYVAQSDGLRCLPPAPEGLIVDNAPETEADARAVLAECDLLGSLTVLLVTQRPVAMPMRRVELSAPTAEDIRTVTQTLARLGYACNQSSLPPRASYWDLLAACV